MSKTAIVDYGLCNLDSISRALEKCGADPMITANPADLGQAERIVLPGTGSFPKAMANLRRLDLLPVLSEQVLERHTPFLGICLGMHLMATRSEEGTESEGLDWIDGDVERLQPVSVGERVPHVGWNEAEPAPDTPLFKGIAPHTDFYFAHSYHLRCRDSSQVMARTPYCGSFVSAIARENIMAVQFHPEKSQGAGFQVLRNFLNL